ncbi:hypothetical protein N431DRAFT_337013 [Stipitochalara longipes BDJ]|nr:hypothetical protein N431DRAFT_337013 [Stipitochalara longipes BDJ]
MTKKTFTSKPPRYQETPSEPDTSLPPPPYTFTPQETTPLISESPSYAGSSYAPSGPSYTAPSYAASSRISEDSSSAGSLPSHFPRRNRTLRHAFRDLRRDYLLATYHRALDAVAARGWRRPSLHWPGSSRSRHTSQCGSEVEGGRGRRERVRVWVRGVRGWGRVGEKKKRRRTVILCCNLLIWVLIALVIAVFAMGLWEKGGGTRWPEAGKRETVRVGIVGAGPAGVSAAHTLSTSFKSKDVNLEIVLFEQKESIGGRMVLNRSFPKERLGRNINAEVVASGPIGGNTIRSRARDLGIDYKMGREPRANEVGFFDGQGIVAKLTRPMSEISWGTWLTLVLKYRFSLWNAKQLPKGTMNTFKGLLESKLTFERVSDMAKSAGIEGAVGLGAVARLSANGVGGDYVHEVLGPQALRQTGQYVTELSDLAISMALEREDQRSTRDSGSFEEILEKFVHRSHAELRLSTNITGLKSELAADGRKSWVLELQKSGHSSLEHEVFDHVIIAGPSSSLLKHIYHEEEVFYRSLFVTLLLSTQELDKGYFGSSEEMPSQILPIQSDNLPSELKGIHEISYVGDIFGPDVNTEAVKKLYRVLSNRSLSRGGLLAFGKEAVLEIHEETIEHAYPLLWPRNGKYGKFNLQDGLWHTGVVEAIGSSVDLSWIAGENVGRLVARDVGPALHRKWSPKKARLSKDGIMK